MLFCLPEKSYVLQNYMLKDIVLTEKNRVKVDHSKPVELCNQRSNKNNSNSLK